MSDYGFQLYNSSGAVLANDTDYNYGLIASGFATTTQYNNPTTFSFTNTSQEMPLIFIRNNQAKYLAFTGLSTTSFSALFFQDLVDQYAVRGVTDGTFEYRVYIPISGMPTATPSGDEYGIQIFDANNKKTFDSTKTLPLITGAASLAPPTSPAAAVSYVALPAGTTTSPWVCINNLPIGQVGWFNVNNGYGAKLVYTAFKVQLGNLYLAQGHRDPPSLDFVYYATQYWGKPDTKTMLLMNSVANEPLSVIVGDYWFQGSSLGNIVCNYNPASANSCQTQRSYIANVSGGNGNPITYQWSIINNSSGFTLISSDNVATITNNLSAGTYTATLRCVVSQSGSTTVTIDTAISHTHTGTANPLAATVSRSNQTLSCSLTSACSTQETLTATPTPDTGNGNAITYAWSLINNTSGFSINSSTGTSTTVSLTATGATTGTTYTCTLRCTVSQSGSTDVVIDSAISHNHTTTSSAAPVNPLGFNGSTYSYTAPAAGDVATIALIVYNNGTWGVQHGGGTAGSGLWYNPQTTDIGSSYYITIIRNSTTNIDNTYGTASASLTTPTVLSTSRQITVQAVPTNGDLSCSANYTIKIFPSSAGTPGTEVTSGTITLAASATYLAPEGA